MNINEAKVIITGGTSGIGYETAKLLKEKGAQVVICGRSNTSVQKTIASLNIYGIEADVSKEKDVEKLFEFALDKMGDYNVLINNAGIGYIAPLNKTTVADFENIWQTNVKGAFMCGKIAAAHFVKKQTGNIINIASTAGLRGFANGSAYVASKFALSGLTECWRAELRPHTIRVMQINPSQVITDFSNKLGYEEKKPETKLKPQQIAHVVHSMLSMDDVGFIPDASVWATNP